ncbi:MAG: DHH family phosphoesterase, partial [Acidobacteria bacterium]|nr:DHH family phosphoesterase [Acidobacteriota bacterium]
MLNEILKQIERRARFVLTSHARPDGDAIGSTLACSAILRHMGKQTQVILRDGVPRVYQKLPFATTVVQSESIDGNYDAAILLECDNIQRTRLEGIEGHYLINIDHHKSGRSFAHLNWIDPQAVATAEMVYRLARAAQIRV